MTPAAPTPNPIHTTAHQLHAAGVATIPTRPDTTKAPAVKWKPYTTTPPTPDQLDTWFTHPTHNYGLGIITGHTSGNLEMTELEGRAAHHIPHLAELAHNTGLTTLWDRLTHGWTEQSPSGGVHFIYRLTGMDVPGNTKIAHDENRNVLAETRGHGGYFIAAPTDGTHHTTGRPWTRLAGGPTTIPTITPTEREAFHTLLATIGAPDPTPTHTPAATPPAAPTGDWTQGARPGEHFEIETPWADILTPHGWTHHHQGHDGTHYWTRPGKNPADGWSASTGHADDRDRLWVYSTSTEFQAEVPYTKFGAWALLNHGGDHATAARALAKDGWGKEPHITLSLDQIMPATTPAPGKDEPTGATPAASPDAPTTPPEKTPTGPSAAAPATSQAASSPRPDTTQGTPSPGPQTPQPLARSEYGNTLRLINAHGHHMRYCPDRGRWLTWNGHVWEWEAPGGGTIRQWALNVACSLPETEQPDIQWKKKSLTAPVITNVLKHAETHPGIAVAFDDLDNQPWELNTPGGIIDLRTGELGPSDPTHLHTRSTLTTPDFTADTTRWEEFLNDTFPNNPRLIDYLQRLCGYSCVGQVREHILPFAFGPGGNGKSVFLDVNAKVLGDYALSAPSGFLMADRFQRHGTEIARLAGARWTNCSEVNEHDRFDEAKVKLLTGGDTLSANFMRRDLFDFTPTHHLWLAGNYWPTVESGGESFWRRLRVIPFTHTIPEHKRVEDLQGILVDEHAPAILAWIARGAADYHRNGLQEPPEVMVATTEYRESQDTVARFLEERCEMHPGNPNYMASVKRFRTEYEAWCYEEGEEPVKGRSLASQLKRHGALVGREAPNVPSGVDRVYGGVQLLSDLDAATADHGRSDLFG